MKEHEFLNNEDKHFNQVFALSSQHQDWDTLVVQMPRLPKGWYELARLPLELRIEFIREYWLSSLSLTSHLEERLNHWFDTVEEIEIFASQVKPIDPFDVHMIYSLKHDAGFFHGSPPASDDNIQILNKQFSAVSFPSDYLGFLRIHDGFNTYTDTGMIRLCEMAKIYQKLQLQLGQTVLIRPDGQRLDPSSLIPFYESHLHCYQCFYADWTVEKEMGNVSFSATDRTLSNFLDRQRLHQNLAFESFMSWLIHYLEESAD